MRNDKFDSDIPLGLGVALVMNKPALKAFGSLSIREQQEFIENAHCICGSEEMKRYVKTLIKEGET